MNLAITTVVVFLLLVPGILFRRFYYSDEFSHQYFKQSFFEVVLSSFLPTTILHSLWSMGAMHLGYEINLPVLFKLVGSSAVPDDAINNVVHNCRNIILYNSSLFAISALSGWSARLWVRELGFDRRFPTLTFRNHWHYLLSGEFFEMPRAAFDLDEDNVRDIELIYVDALMTTSVGSVLYDGVLVNYQLIPDGSGIEYIVISDVQRRYLKDDPKGDKYSNYEEILLSAVPDEEQNGVDDTYYDIPGHIMILPYSEIINLNITFYKIDVESDIAILRQVT